MTDDQHPRDDVRSDVDPMLGAQVVIQRRRRVVLARADETAEDRVHVGAARVVQYQVIDDVIEAAERRAAAGPAVGDGTVEATLALWLCLLYAVVVLQPALQQDLRQRDGVTDLDVTHVGHARVGRQAPDDGRSRRRRRRSHSRLLVVKA